MPIETHTCAQCRRTRTLALLLHWLCFKLFVIPFDSHTFELFHIIVKPLFPVIVIQSWPVIPTRVKIKEHVLSSAMGMNVNAERDTREQIVNQVS